MNSKVKSPEELSKEIGEFLIWEEHWLKEWHNLPMEDKKILAALHWEKLTPLQQSEFHGPEYITMVKAKEAEKIERYTNPVKLRKYFLEKAGPVLDNMIDAAIDNKKTLNNEYATAQIWEVLKGVITQAKSAAPLLDLKGGSIEDQIDIILTGVSTGDLTFDEAKEYMSLVSSGFDLQQLPKIMEKLELLEKS